jgi:hypothetical protein
MHPTRTWPISAIAIFFFFGALMGALGAWLLVVPGTRMDLLWAANPRAHTAFQHLGNYAISLMALISLVCAITAAGVWRLRRWGQAAAVAVLSINLLGDIGNVILLHDNRALIGVPVGGLMIGYLVKFRGFFT